MVPYGRLISYLPTAVWSVVLTLHVRKMGKPIRLPDLEISCDINVAFLLGARVNIYEQDKITCAQFLLIQHGEMYVNLPSYKIVEFLQVATG